MNKKLVLTTFSLLAFLTGYAAQEHRSLNYASVHSSPRSPSASSHTTPLDQSETETDRQITLQIRKALMEDNCLSSKAKNLKIITVNGLVTLRGPVSTKEEKSIVVAKARQIAGTKNVEYYIDVLT